MTSMEEVMAAKKRLMNATHRAEATARALADAEDENDEAGEEMDAAKLCYERALLELRADSPATLVQILALDCVLLGVVNGQTYVTNGEALLGADGAHMPAEFSAPPISEATLKAILPAFDRTVGSVSVAALKARCKGESATDPRNRERQVAVAIDGITVDAALVRKYVLRAAEVFGDTSLRVGHGDEFAPVAFIGNGWRAVVMPLRVSPDRHVELSP